MTGEVVHTAQAGGGAEVRNQGRPAHLRSPSALFLMAGLTAAGLFLLMPRPGAVGAILYTGLGLAEPVALVVGLRRYRPSRPRPWRLLAVGTALYSVGNVMWYAVPILGHIAARFPSPADAIYVGAYLTLIAGLAAMVASRRGGHEGFGSLIDAAMVTFSAGVLAWEYVIQPLNTGLAHSLLARLVSLAYPVLDLALLALLARLLLGRRIGSPAFRLLCAALVTQLAADCAYMVSTLHDRFYLGHPLTVGWMLSFTLLGAAALHPSMASLSDPPAHDVAPTMSIRRLMLVVGTAAVIPGLFSFDHPSGSATEILICTSTLFILAVARTAVLIHDLTRTGRILVEQEDELRQTVKRLRRTESDLAHQANHDPLTGLPNRALFEARLADVRPSSEQPVAVMLLDLDGFKTVNDSLGHATGDGLLRAVGSRLASALRQGDVVARLGGDEFAVLAEGMGAQGPGRLADRLLYALEGPVMLDGHSLSVRASIGIAVGTTESTVNALLRDADAAMYEAKRKGGQRYELFTPDMHARILDRLALECDLRAARLGSEISLHYQPLVELTDGRLSGFEALMRWKHPTMGMVPPDQFIPVAEETGLIIRLGSWALREACRQVCEWSRGHPEVGPLGISVNVSARQLAQPEFIRDVAAVLAESGFPAHLLTLELTETMMLTNEYYIGDQLAALKALGTRISVDDFGTGYSSLAHLRSFPVDELKIDRSFVASLGSGAGSDVASATIRLARSLEIDVVAEGIEEQSQLDELRRSTCTRGQDYLLGRPMDAVGAEALLDAVTGPLLPPSALPFVLVVEDDSDLRQSLARALQREGFRTAEAEDGRQALQMAGTLPLDAVLLDIHLPDSSGLAVCENLRAKSRTAGLALVCLSGAARSTTAKVVALDNGADAYLVKPVAPAEVAATIRATLRSRREPLRLSKIGA